MKKYLFILLAAFCVLLPTLVLAQESTTLKTTVPSEHTITIVCGEHGQAVIDDKTYSGTFAMQAERLGTLVIKAQPDKGYGFSQIKVSDLDGVTVKGRSATLSGIHCENTVTLTFYKLPTGSTDSSATNSKPDAAPESDLGGSTSPNTEAQTESSESTLEDTEAQTESSGSTLEDTAAQPESSKSTLADAVTLPEASATGNVLSDEYIGTENGPGQLSIVFDGEEQQQDYELLNIKSANEDQKNTVLVRVYPDENEDVAHRSLILSTVQLVKLVQKQETEQLIFENGETAVTVDLADLLGGDVQKLIGLIVKGSEEISAETLDRDWSLVQTEVLTAEELALVRTEIRIVPVELEDGSIAYDISVWLHWDDLELEISSMLPSLRVSLHVDDNSSDQYVIGVQAEDTEGFLPLDSTLVLPPEAMPEDQPDEAEKFIVTMPEEEGDTPVTAYDTDASLSKERHSTVTAAYAGKGFYKLIKAEKSNN